MEACISLTTRCLDALLRSLPNRRPSPPVLVSLLHPIPVKVQTGWPAVYSLESVMASRRLRSNANADGSPPTPNATTTRAQPRQRPSREQASSPNTALSKPKCITSTSTTTHSASDAPDATARSTSTSRQGQKVSDNRLKSSSDPSR
jgi:hypothetical protein